jgi:tRNA(adenine34) deaminase
MSDDDEIRWMRHALALAAQGEANDEVPVGCVIVRDGQPIGEGWNRPISSNDPTAHAEIVALRDAAQRIGNYRLTGATLYVTLEPCLMCAGAMLHARIERLVFGAADPRRGAVNSTAHAFATQGLNHRIEVLGGVLEDACADRLRAFFRGRRG